MKKTFQNESGNILIRSSKDVKGACGIVEMLHLHDKNSSGCVIASWYVNKSDINPVARFESCDDRFPNTKYSFDIMEAVHYGQNLANLLLESED